MNRGFYTCPICGCHLDPGEKCDCREQEAKDQAKKELEQAYTDQKKRRAA